MSLLDSSLHDLQHTLNIKRSRGDKNFKTLFLAISGNCSIISIALVILNNASYGI